MSRRSLMMAAAVAAALAAPTHAQTSTAAAPGASSSHEDGVDRLIDAGSGYRIVRFVAWTEGEIPPRGADGHFRASGTVRPESGADFALGDASAAYTTVVTDTGIKQGEFVDTGSIHFAKGELRFTAAVPTHNDKTPIGALEQTVLIERISGGDGVFEGASGYFLMNVTLEPPTLPGRAPTRNFKFRGTMNGLIFLREGPSSHQ